MFKYTATYADFNDVEHTEDLYFHMMAPEMVDLEFNPMVNGSMSDFVREAFKNNDGAKIYTFSKLMLLNSYGRRSDDGAKFTKKPEWTEEFINSPAYEAFFMWLTIEDPSGGHMQSFWEGIVPKRVLEQTAELEAKSGATVKKKLTELSKEELLELMQKKLSEKSIEA